jgi:Tol biopolymer transport system component
LLVPTAESPTDAGSGSGRASSSALGDGGASDDAGCGAPWVVFVLQIEDFGGQQLYARRADGTDGHPIVLPQQAPSFPWISADGAALIYTVEGGGGLYLHRFTDGSDQAIAHPSGVLSGFAALAPDGSSIAYSTNAGLELAPLTGAGAGQATLLVPSSAVGELGDSPAFPVFSADGAQIVFGTHTAIGLVDVGSDTLEVLLENPEGFVGVDNASFSPDRQRLVAGVGCPVGTYGLRVYTFADLPDLCEGGTLIASFGAPGATPFYPTWGPTGLIAYWNGEYDVMLVPAVGGQSVNLTSDLTAGGDGVAWMPAWAPACTEL